MADGDNKEGILSKALNAFENYLDNRMEKGAKVEPDFAPVEEDVLYRKSAYKDPSYSIGAQGYQDKTARLSFNLLREMAVRDTVVSAIIQNYQNDVSDFAKPAKAKYEKGFKIVPKNERQKILKLIAELFPEQKSEKKEEKDFNKASDPLLNKEEAMDKEDNNLSEDLIDDAINEASQVVAEPLTLREKERIAKEELVRRNLEKIEKLKDLVMSCGNLENRSFEDRRWNFEGLLRAIVRDTLTFDQYAIERIPNNEGKLNHWVPVDGATIRFATPALKQQKGQIASEFGYDILFPEKELEAMQQSDAIQLDEKKLENDEYKWVQVIRGKIERGFTEQELVVGMRNPTTNVYSNGYSVPELEVLVNTISSHIFTENYNRMYFTQGFSAKGILHIKAPLPRRKLEAFRLQWNHLLKGNKNSFQTPIVSGMDEIQWIPLTQNHSDMEFSNWMNYLIKIICSLFQIDPMEIGFGMKEEGRTGGNMGGDNTQEKLKLSREKGLKPMMTHLQNFFNQNIINQIDPEFELVFVGLDDESQQEAISRQEKEVKFKKTVNEIRAEDELPPLDGCDKLLLDPNYMQYYMNMSPDGLKAKQQMNEQQMQMQSMQDGTLADPKVGEELENQKDQPEEEEVGTASVNPQKAPEEEVQKSLLTIEHYTLPKE
jgi:hypothetical protein